MNITRMTHERHKEDGIVVLREMEWTEVKRKNGEKKKAQERKLFFLKLLFLVYPSSYYIMFILRFLLIAPYRHLIYFRLYRFIMDD